jgi:hypothetical protein
LSFENVLKKPKASSKKLELSLVVPDTHNGDESKGSSLSRKAIIKPHARHSLNLMAVIAKIKPGDTELKI